MEAALVRTVLADPRPVRALREQIEALLLDHTAAADALAVGLFECVFHRLPPFADAELLRVAAEAHRRLGRTEAGWLLDGVAAQITTPLPCPDGADEARTILAQPDPGAWLLATLERHAAAGAWEQAHATIRAVWPSLPPVGHFWVYQRMAEVYDRLSRPAATRVMDLLTIQFSPADNGTEGAYRRLLDGFRAAGRARAAAELVLFQRAALPAVTMIADDALAALRAAAGPLAAGAPAPGRVHAIFPAETRLPQTWQSFNGIPQSMIPLTAPMQRPAVTITEIADAVVLVEHDQVAVLDAQGMLLTELSVGRLPALLPHRFATLARAGAAPAEQRLDLAVLVSDEFPAPNVCHFLFDHASRLLLYRRAGIDLAAAAAIGPALRTEFQTETVARIGVGAWHATDAPAQFRVRRLLVSSNCRHVRHTAHWGAGWAVDSVRALFDLVPHAPRRRLLVSRADAPTRRIVNEDALEALLAPHGFERIVPGRMPFAAQIAAFRDASHIVAPHGGGLGNLMFCAPGTEVLEILHPQYGTWSYAISMPALGIAYRTLVAADGESEAAEFNDPKWPLPERHASMHRSIRVDPADLRRWLAVSGAL